MSKQAIQAARHRKRWLLLPAFLAVALVVIGGNWLASDTAKADVTGADYVMSGPFSDAAATVAAMPPLAGNSTVYWKLTATLTQPTVGALAVTINVAAVAGSPLTITSVSPAGGPSPSCFPSPIPAGSTTVTCFYPPNMSTGTTFTLIVGTNVGNNGVDIPAGAVSVTADDASDQPAQTGTPAPAAVVAVDAGPVADPSVTVAKSNTQSKPGMVTGDTGFFTVTLTNNGPQRFVTASFTDTIPANIQVTSIVFNDGTGSCSASITGAPPVTLPFSGPGTLYCYGIDLGDSFVFPPDVDTVTFNYTVINWDGSQCALGSGLQPRTNSVTATFDGEDPDTTPEDSDTASANAFLACLGSGGPGDIVHLDPFGSIVDTADVNNNLIGFVHQVCARNLIVDGIYPNTGATTVIDPISGQPIPATLNFKISKANDHGDPNIVGAQVTTFVDCDGDGEEDDSLLTWYSSEPGEQFITIVDDGGNTKYDFGGPFPGDPPRAPNPLVKEWNVLEPTVITVGGVDVTNGTVPIFVFSDGQGGFDSFGPVKALEHVTGSHDQGNGVTFVDFVNGALVTFKYNGSCGVLTVGVAGKNYLLVSDTDPLTFTTEEGPFEVLPGETLQLISTADQDPLTSDAIPFSVDTAGCTGGGSDFGRVDISADYLNSLGSVNPTIADEFLIIDFVVGPPTNKQPLLAWAGQRVVLEHNWRLPNGVCPWVSSEPGYFYVQWAKQNGPGSFIQALPGSDSGAPSYTSYYAESEDAWGRVWSAPLAGNPESDCISRALYESQDQGEVDISHWVEDSNSRVISQQVPFLIYYMELEDVTLGVVAGSFDGHNNSGDPLGRFSNTNPWNTATDTTSATANVSADVLLRARVRGWFTTTQITGRPARAATLQAAGAPAGRWIMPDDWELLAGGVLAESFRPNYDIMFAPDSGYSCSTVDSLDIGTDRDVSPENCSSASGQGAFANTSTAGTINHTNVQGPFSLLDTPGTTLGGATGSKAPHNPTGFRNTILPDGDVDLWDAPMPPAHVRFRLTGSGFLKDVNKGNVYSTGTNPYYVTNIPAEPWITQFNSDGSGYLINTWADGAPYVFWDAVATGAAVTSAPGAVPTGGWTAISVYSDNHGEAMAVVNGDAGLTFSQCSDAASLAANGIVLISGFFCQAGDLVGTSTVNAVADYPDKRKFAPLLSNPVTVNWLWAGTKRVDIVPGENVQFNYVVFTVTDRDGFCGGGTSLHPVLGELVDFIIDGGQGIIIETNEGLAIGTREAHVHTFDTAAFPGLAKGTLGGCQAWIKVSNSLGDEPLNVLVIAHDPEGTITFDRIIDFSTTTSYNLSFRWSLITWAGVDNIPVTDALKGTGANALGNDIFGDVTAVYGWDQVNQQWLGFFPSGVDVPGANDLTVLRNGQAYWVAIEGPGGITWIIATP